MKNSRIVISTAAALTILATLGFTAQPGRSQPSRTQAPVGNKRMHLAMEKMGDALKATAKSIQAEEDTKKTLRHLEDLQEQMVKAKSMTPHTVKELDDKDEQLAQTREFRRQMIGVLQQTLEMELLLLDGDSQGAFDIVAGELLDLRKAGHGEFQPED